MAAVNVEGVNYAKYNSTPPQMVDVDQWGGRVRVMYDTYTETAAMETGSTIKVGRLPKGARFLYGYITTSKSLGTTTVKIEIGSTEVRAAAVHTTAVVPQLFGKNTGTQIDTASDVVITTATANSPGDAVIQTAIFYTVD